MAVATRTVLLLDSEDVAMAVPLAGLLCAKQVRLDSCARCS